MRFEFSPEAKTEFDDGERFYEQQLRGLGRRFRADVRDALVLEPPDAIELKRANLEVLGPRARPDAEREARSAQHGNGGR